MSENITLSPDVATEVNPRTRFERKDINVPAVVFVGAILAVIVVVSCLISLWVFDILYARDRANKASRFPLAAEEGDQSPTERKQPLLEQIDRTEAAKKGQAPILLYDAELERLKTFGWVDEQQQIVHIPIDQAMKLIVEQKRLRSRDDAAK